MPADPPRAPARRGCISQVPQPPVRSARPKAPCSTRHAARKVRCMSPRTRSAARAGRAHRSPPGRQDPWRSYTDRRYFPPGTSAPFHPARSGCRWSGWHPQARWWRSNSPEAAILPITSAAFTELRLSIPSVSATIAFRPGTPPGPLRPSPGRRTWPYRRVQKVYRWHSSAQPYRR